MDGTAVVLTQGRLDEPHAKTAHGLIRSSDRFRLVGVIDAKVAGRDAGEVLDGRPRGIPCFSSLEESLPQLPERPDFCIVGIATHGGALTDDLRLELKKALDLGISVVNGLHGFAGDDHELVAAAQQTGARIIDVRRTAPRDELHFWDGRIYSVRAPRLALLGTDCALGKRTTARLLVKTLGEVGVQAEMIYTGQTGWMQGARYGFIFDSVPNDFVSGELEHAVWRCDQEAAPDLIVLEGQSSLRNPSGPAGPEFLTSAAARGVILQHAPARTHYKGYEEFPEAALPSLEEEIELIRLYGSRVIALALSSARMETEELHRRRDDLQKRLGLPVALPLEDMAPLVEVARQYLEEQRGGEHP